MPSGSPQTPARQKLGGLHDSLGPSQPAPALAERLRGDTPRTGQGTHTSSHPSLVCDVPAQQYLKLSTRVTVALSKELPFLLPTNCLIPSPGGWRLCGSDLHPGCFSCAPAKRSGELRGFGPPRRMMREGWRVARATFPRLLLPRALLHAGYFCAGLPADSPHLPRLRRSGRARLFDLPGEHSVCFGDAWPELTSLQMVSK